MKKRIKQVISVVLALVMLLSVLSAGFSAFAEEEQKAAMPPLQTMLGDGKALKTYLEGNFLNLEQADALAVKSLPALAETLCAQLGELFFQMGYNEEQYPKDEAGLMLALARVISSLEVGVFREPEKVETIDMSLIYNLAYIGGTDYIESVNAALPEALRFDTEKPVLALSKSQMAQITDYYARWQAGALRMDDFDIQPYLGETTPAQFLKAVLLVFIADDARLPMIAKKAIDFDLTTERKAIVAKAVADILDNLHEKPVSALLRNLSDKQFQAVLTALVQTADKVTRKTDWYVYKIFNEGIYTDTDGSAIPYIADNGDGTYSITGPGFVGDYLPVIEAAFDLLEGSYESLNTSVLQTLLKEKLPALRALVSCAPLAVTNTIHAEQAKARSDKQAAEIEKRFAQAQLEKIESGADKQAKKEALQQQLDALSEQISALQSDLLALELEEATVKQTNKSYYDALAELEEEINEENEEQITSSPEYIAAKSRVEQVEASLAENYEQQASLKAQIAKLSSDADVCANDLADFESNYSEADAATVYRRMERDAEAVIAQSDAALSALPDTALTEQVSATLGELVDKLFAALDGVYDKMMQESPLAALIQFVYGLKGFADTVENLDWESLAAVTDPLFDNLDASINAAAGKYIGENGGANILADLSAFVDGSLTQYSVNDYLSTDSLNRFIKEEILADNSSILQSAASALGAMFPGVEPNYESIVSCIIPILSAFDFSALTSPETSIDQALQIASPSAFAYLAGLESENLTTGYLNEINASLRQNGYEGEPVQPILSLSSAQASALLNYVRMEKEGVSLADIAAAGFVWSNYSAGANRLEIADSLIKLALGDANKLGSVASAPGVGQALIHLLCDLVYDIQADPVNTILKKISNREDLAVIADFAMDFLNQEDKNYMSYELFYKRSIFYDENGELTFYAYDNGETITYIGPKSLEMYVPIVAAVLDFLNGFDSCVENRDGDLLKALLFDKVQDIGNLLSSVISYKDISGKEHAGALFYLLMGYGDYLKNENASLCYDILAGVARTAIKQQQQQIVELGEECAIWEGYLEQAKQKADAAKLAKAKELGVVDESLARYDEGEILAGIREKADALKAQMEQTSALIAEDEAAIATAQSAYNEAKDAASAYKDKLAEMESFIFDGATYGYLDDIIYNQSLDAIDDFRTECEEDFDALFGAGKFEQLLNTLTDCYTDYNYTDEDAGVFATDDFIDDTIFYGGWNLYAQSDVLDTQIKSAQYALTTAQESKELHDYQLGEQEKELAKYEPASAVLEQIQAAGEAEEVKLFINDTEINQQGRFSVTEIERIIADIQNNAIASCQAEIQEQTEAIENLEQQKLALGEQLNRFNTALIPLASAASGALAQGIINILCGNQSDGSENVYHYIKNGNVAAILTTGGRPASFIRMLTELYPPLLQALVSERMLAAQTAEQLVAAVPDLSAFFAGPVEQFPAKFEQNPVGAIGTLIRAFCLEMMAGFDTLEQPVHDCLQMKRINRDIVAIFDEDFSEDWLHSYTRCAVDRVGEIYQLIVDILGLSFVKDFIGITPGTNGSITGKIDTSNLYSDATISLYDAQTLVASVSVAKDSDGSFVFENLPEGNYVLKMSTHASVPFTVKSIEVLADSVTDLSEGTDKDTRSICVPVGDTNGDGVVNVEDINRMALPENFGSSGEQCDINCDGVVDIADLSIILAEGNYAAEATVISF